MYQEYQDVVGTQWMGRRNWISEVGEGPWLLSGFYRIDFILSEMGNCWRVLSSDVTLSNFLLNSQTAIGEETEWGYMWK